ncbi:MAG: branched-chain amino acid ABC transporter permease, partial [Candidatus Omnitrophica bacterium]|nr:branched-chain amino acid ABC transporter permease [Candidatus Omnitrophota bacterium]
METRRNVMVVIAALLAVLIITPFSGSYVIILVTHALIFAILAMSVDILLGYTGLPSLGQAAYLGMGAYLTAILAARFQFGLDWTFWIVIVLGILIGAATAALFGLLALRAVGVYFLMITLALAMCVWGLAYRWNSLTGGDNGIVLPPRPQFGIQLADDITFFYLVFGFFVAALVMLYILVRSPFGRSLVGIRENELRMRILGYNTWLHKYLAFVLAGTFAGVAGVLFAYHNGLMFPPHLGVFTSALVSLIVIIGGAGTLY